MNNMKHSKIIKDFYLAAASFKGQQWEIRWEVISHI